MSSSSSARGAASQRYRALKLYNAAQEFIRALTPPASSSSAAASGRASSGAAASSSSSPSSGSRAAGGEGGLSEAFGSAVAKFREAYNQQMTSVVYMAGAAMAPALNKAALEDKEAVEKLVVRAIPRPSPRTVLVGDVVAFTSPLSGLGTGGDAAVEMMVRRVAALEGDELVAMGGSGSGAAEGGGEGSSSATASASASSSGGGGEAEDVMEVPPGHCWVLADNETLKPSQVIDSRTFGHMPLTNIVGRVIYSATSRRDHGPVMNNPISVEADQAIIEGEVDVDKLYPPAF